MTTERQPDTLEPIFPFWAIWKWKWTVLAVTLAVSAGSLALGAARSVRYEAIARLVAEVSQVPGELGHHELLSNYFEVSRQALLMHAELLKTHAAMAAIANTSHAVDEKLVRARLRAELGREPMTLQIAAWDERPERAAALANAAARYAVSRAGTVSREIDDKQAYLRELRAFDTRLALQVKAQAEGSIQADIARREHLITAVRREVTVLERQVAEDTLRAAESPAGGTLSLKRDELNRLQEEQKAATETLERLRLETERAAQDFEIAKSEYLSSALSVVSRMADLRLLQAAEVPRQPMPRHLNLIGAIGAIGGFLTGVLAVLYAEYRRFVNLPVRG